MAEQQVERWLSNFKRNKKSKMCNYYVLRILIVSVLFQGISNHLDVYPSPNIKKAIGESLTLSINSNASLNDSFSHIVVYHDPNFDCGSTLDVLYNSKLYKVSEGTSNRGSRYRIDKRSRLDFKMVIERLQVEDQGCFHFQELSLDSVDEMSTNLTLENGTVLGSSRIKIHVTPNQTKSLTAPQIAGIVIGCATCACAMAVLIVIVIKKLHVHRKDQPRTFRTTQEKLLDKEETNETHADQLNNEDSIHKTDAQTGESCHYRTQTPDSVILGVDPMNLNNSCHAPEPM